jgi:hypothetical protein
MTTGSKQIYLIYVRSYTQGSSDREQFSQSKLEEKLN